MTKDEHKNAIVTQLQQQSLNLLVDSLAAALAERGIAFTYSPGYTLRSIENTEGLAD
jgi:hypothetical protein